ncbi:acylamino-acid-releasing enzyme-like isoform X1 [Lineus longissimus]|uniref:acylamino-acid-releasing enzyme-like isoform X1 n=1 Tax=Lineus longissimus TaxID=88925 RepID=UPI002B4D4FBC
MFRHYRRMLATASAAVQEKMIEEVVNIYRELAKLPVPSSGSILNGKGKAVTVHSQWTQRDIERSEKVKFSRSHVVSKNGDEMEVVASSFPQDCTNESWNKVSPSGKLRVIMRKVPNKKGEDKQFIEIWCDNHKTKNIDVQNLDKHGKVYEPDGQFAVMEWSFSERKLLYIAERKVTKSASYFDKKTKDSDEESCKATEEVTKGDEHVYREDWGEQLVGKHHPVICILDLDSEEVEILKSVPEDVSPGQATWCADDAGIVFTGWNHEPYRLGLIYCTQRRSAIYHIDLKSSACNQLNSGENAVRCPTFSSDHSILVWMETDVLGPHASENKLIMYDWNTKESSVVLDYVNSSQGDDFPGLFTGSFPARCWSSDNKRLITHSGWRSRSEIIVINVETKKVIRLTNDALFGNWIVLDVCDDLILAHRSSPCQPHAMVLGHLPASGKETDIKWMPLESEAVVFEDIKWEVIRHQVPSDAINPKYPSVIDYESILYQPANTSQEDKPPLVLFPHGGPHSMFTAEFMLYAAGLCKCGFAVQMVNFRGSLGFGQDNVYSLLGNVGSQDVKDCYRVLEETLETKPVNREKLCVMGGSHGGFLTAHLIGQYPDTFKAAVCRNPVINVGSMLSVTDIPDWTCTETFGVGHFDYKDSARPEDYEAMWKHSPISHCDKMKTPTMIMLGSNDLRVPPKQGLAFYKALKSRAVPVRVLMYADNSHPLNKVDTEADAFVNIVHWFVKHL